MAANFVTRGWGQVEANRLTAITTGHMESQAPAYSDVNATAPIPELENGMLLCVVPDVSGKSPMGRIAVLPGVAPATAMPLLVYSERKVYDERLGYSDFVDKASEKVDGTLYPRLIGIMPDTDVFTTNTVNAAAGSLAVGDKLFVGDDGYLTETAGVNTAIHFEVVKVYTMPDGQPGVKLMSKMSV